MDPVRLAFIITPRQPANCAYYGMVAMRGTNQLVTRWWLLLHTTWREVGIGMPANQNEER